MKKKQKILLLAAALMLGVCGAQAQDMRLFVHSGADAPQSFALSDIDKITFSSDTINVLPKSGVGSNIALSSVSRLTFAVVTDTVPLPPTDTVPDPPTGVNAVDVSALEVFPNPVRDELLVTSGTEIETVVVFNLSGNVLLRRNVRSYTATLSLGFLPAGMYLIQVKRADATNTLKVIKL
ncbi:hypothetical protein FACS189456_0010 [Bacteroidia bacterium]|nr:hypothetical protein FACS189456_0010 [Bacteroidia bacterium]